MGPIHPVCCLSGCLKTNAIHPWWHAHLLSGRRLASICTKYGCHLTISPPRVDSSKGPNRENGAHQGKQANTYLFLCFSIHGKKSLGWPQMGPGGFFPTNPNLVDILDRTDLDFETFVFILFLIFRIPNFWNFRLQNSGFPKIWICLLYTSPSPRDRG